MQSNDDQGGDAGWGALSTEARHPRSMDLDKCSPEQIVGLVLDEDRLGIEAARLHTADIALAAGWVGEALSGGGRLVLAGAGTSGRLGVLEAAECPPTFGTDPLLIQAAIAGGPDAVYKAREGAEDDREAGQAVGSDLARGDVLIGLSASSVTPFALGAIEAARSRGARTVLLSCAPSRKVSDVADLVICLDTGPEILTGSTRLKAGSATKAVLNAITTAAMVGIGKVYENMMVDLRAGSAKLLDRSVRIVSELAEVNQEQAQRLLERAHGEVKTAIVMERQSLDVEEARTRLALNDGNLRAALELSTGGPAED